MPVFFQQQINETTRMAIWKIEETKEFFIADVPLQREITHPHKRLQHLAGRFLLKYLFPGFPYELIEIADTKKPFLPGDQFHFSISHCGDYAAAIVSTDKRVGVDIEIPTEKVERIKHKFLSDDDIANCQLPIVNSQPGSRLLTKLWSAKEAVFKWYGEGGVDFRSHIVFEKINFEEGRIHCNFKKTGHELLVNVHEVGELVMAWVVD